MPEEILILAARLNELRISIGSNLQHSIPSVRRTLVSECLLLQRRRYRQDPVLSEALASVPTIGAVGLPDYAPQNF